jgi:hypothetical protein
MDETAELLDMAVQAVPAMPTWAPGSFTMTPASGRPLYPSLGFETVVALDAWVWGESVQVSESARP